MHYAVLHSHKMQIKDSNICGCSINCEKCSKGYEATECNKMRNYQQKIIGFKMTALEANVSNKNVLVLCILFHILVKSDPFKVTDSVLYFSTK